MPSSLRFSDFELDLSRYELRRDSRVVKMERIPMDLLVFLVEQRRRLVTREEIVERIWGQGVFVDTENAVNTAVRKVRQALKDDPARPQLLETVPGRGYRFIADVTVHEKAIADEDGKAAMDGVTAGAPSGVSRVPRTRWILWLAAGAVAAVGIAVWSWSAWRHRIADPTSSPAIRSLAVLPLENLSRDPEQEYFADGMTDELITQMAKISALRVISRTSVMRLKGTRKPMAEIAQELNVDAVVEGTVLRSPDRVRVTVQVIQVNPEKHLWAERYDRPLGDIVILQGELAREITQAIRIKLTPQERSRLADATPINHEAYEALLKGRYFLNKRTEETTKKAIAYFQQAIAKEPGYALAFIGLADAYVTLAVTENMQEALPPNEAFPKARAAADRALEIDDTLAEAHTSLAHIRFIYDRDWSGAEREFQRAIELNPSYAQTFQLYAFNLLWMGRTEEALKAIKRAQELDPLALNINVNMAFILSSARQYNQAIEQCRKTLEMDPNFALAHYRLGEIHVFNGNYLQAVPELEKAIALSGGSPRVTAELGLAYALAGNKEQARKLLQDLKELSKRRYVSPYDLAVIYGGLGERDRALEWLERAYQDRSPSLSHIKLSPAFVQLHLEPRFIDLVRRVGLPT